MADETTASEGAPRRKREAPTIDLTATDVTPAASEPPPTEQQAASEAPVDAPPPPEEPAATVADAATSPEPAASALIAEWARQIAAGVAGGGVVAVVFGALWYGGAFSGPRDDNGAPIASLQQQIDALRNRPAPQGDSSAVNAIAQRVAKIEDALKASPQGDGTTTERLTAAENAMKSLGAALAALTQRSNDAATNAMRAREQAHAAEKAVVQLRGSVQDAARDASSAVTPAQIETLAQRLAALEQSSKSERDELSSVAARGKATRLALSASTLRTAVVSGAPFGAELAQAKALGAADRYTAPLSPFAASGVPSATALAQELRALMPQVAKLAGAPAATGSFIERLQANAGRLVKVTPIDAPAGDDTAAVLTRLEVESAQADIAGALADLGKLPEAARAPAQGFIAKAKARETALAAARDLAADTARALGSR